MKEIVLRLGIKTPRGELEVARRLSAEELVLGVTSPANTIRAAYAEMAEDILREVKEAGKDGN